MVEQQRDVALEADCGLRPDDAQKQAHVIFADSRGLTLPRAERADHALEPEADLLSTRRIVETGSAVQRTDRPDCLADRSRPHRPCGESIDVGGDPCGQARQRRPHPRPFSN